jgi:hypothetical protein
LDNPFDLLQASPANWIASPKAMVRKKEVRWIPDRATPSRRPRRWRTGSTASSFEAIHALRDLRRYGSTFVVEEGQLNVAEQQVNLNGAG